MLAAPRAPTGICTQKRTVRNVRPDSMPPKACAAGFRPVKRETTTETRMGNQSASSALKANSGTESAPSSAKAARRVIFVAAIMVSDDY